MPAAMLPAEHRDFAEPPCALAEVLDRVLHKGAALEGNVTIGLADVDLLFLDLRLLLAAVDTVWPDGVPFRSLLPRPEPPPSGQSGVARGEAISSTRYANPGGTDQPGSGSNRPAAALLNGIGPPERQPDNSPGGVAAKGLVRLVLTLVKLLHDVLELQAVRRMTGGKLSATQIEDVGSALLAQAEEIERMRRQFGLSQRDLALDLGLADTPK